MLWVVHVDDRAAVFPHLFGLVEDLGASGGTELAGPATDVEDVGVVSTAQNPRAGDKSKRLVRTKMGRPFSRSRA
ncbi:hypothetical protein I553_4897 [Mycobacterium xenopi 4042]|uniref:Uncharacterized protein n=1 Tax=Mycobacterium xenopi 4042 TaxID=1299334 RepID=X8AIE0_MYCXE|nr:hypothetical protein I553_4897 [Mycobacterium xenopi 4042]EUA51409.1 hypothetical protein I552_2350 [Mycobacterium xenopi 3993]